MAKVLSLLTGLLPFLGSHPVSLSALMARRLQTCSQSQWHHHFLKQLFPHTPLNHLHFIAWQLFPFNTWLNSPGFFKVRSKIQVTYPIYAQIH